MAKASNVELPKVKPTDVAILPYSSGTTGIPKGVMLTHRNLLVNILQMEKLATPNKANIQDTVLTVLPFFHIFGFNMNLNFLTYMGMHTITIPKFTPQDYINCLERYKPTILFVVPSLLMFLLTHPAITAQHLSGVRNIVCGAAPATKSLLDKFAEKFGQECNVQQGLLRIFNLIYVITKLFIPNHFRIINLSYFYDQLCYY